MCLCLRASDTRVRHFPVPGVGRENAFASSFPHSQRQARSRVRYALRRHYWRVYPFEAPDPLPAVPVPPPPPPELIASVPSLEPTRRPFSGAPLPKDRHTRTSPHRLVIPPNVLRDLFRPVYLYETPICEAAQRLGTTDAVIRRWVHRGRLEVRYFKTRLRGKLTPLLTSSGPIDPNYAEGKTPGPHWANMWQYFHEHIPDEYFLVVDRVPRLRIHPKRGRLEFRGFDFLCPGRLTPAPPTTQEPRPPVTGPAFPFAPLQHEPCGRRVRRLYFPVPLFTAPHYLGLVQRVRTGDNPNDRLFPLLDFFSLPRGFACAHCWKPIFTAATTPDAVWNLFVTHMTAGLLQGRNIPRPPNLIAPSRKAP
jgi:hypothetical protein